MTRRRSRRARQPRCLSQIVIAFPTKGSLDAKERAEIVALLSRLLLQVARSRVEREVADDPS